MSDTPRTDELIYSSVDLSQSTIAEFAQTLERENAALREHIARMGKSITPAVFIVEQNKILREQLKECHENGQRLLAVADSYKEENAALREALSRLIEVHDAMGGKCGTVRIAAEEALLGKAHREKNGG